MTFRRLAKEVQDGVGSSCCYRREAKLRKVDLSFCMRSATICSFEPPEQDQSLVFCLHCSVVSPSNMRLYIIFTNVQMRLQVISQQTWKSSHDRMADLDGMNAG
jgi:hypothetical protein